MVFARILSLHFDLFTSECRCRSCSQCSSDLGVVAVHLFIVLRAPSSSLKWSARIIIFKIKDFIFEKYVGNFLTHTTLMHISENLLTSTIFI